MLMLLILANRSWYARPGGSISQPMDLLKKDLIPDWWWLVCVSVCLLVCLFVSVFVCFCFCLFLFLFVSVFVCIFSVTGVGHCTFYGSFCTQSHKPTCIFLSLSLSLSLALSLSLCLSTQLVPFSLSPSQLILLPTLTIFMHIMSSPPLYYAFCEKEKRWGEKREC